MPSELSPQNIRDVRFREKLRGYHPEDVDAFVANVAATVESLHRRINELAAAAADAADGQPPRTGDDVEESLRRTLVLAQRTADMAIKEAQDEAMRLVGEAEAQREEILREVETLRTRTMVELENELSSYRQRLQDEREALQRDVEALQSYVGQERERLRIYFSQQLQRIDEGVPGVEPPPPIEATSTPEPPPAISAESAVVVDEPGLPVEPATAPPEPVDVDVPVAADEEDDPFLAELRRAVTDTEPLGPRDESTETPPAERNGDGFDIFDDEQNSSRFLRRRR